MYLKFKNCRTIKLDIASTDGAIDFMFEGKRIFKFKRSKVASIARKYKRGQELDFFCFTLSKNLPMFYLDSEEMGKLCLDVYDCKFFVRHINGIRKQELIALNPEAKKQVKYTTASQLKFRKHLLPLFDIKLECLEIGKIY